MSCSLTVIMEPNKRLNKASELILPPALGTILVSGVLGWAWVGGSTPILANPSKNTSICWAYTRLMRGTTVVFTSISLSFRFFSTYPPSKYYFISLLWTGRISFLRALSVCKSCPVGATLPRPLQLPQTRPLTLFLSWSIDGGCRTNTIESWISDLWIEE